MKTFTNITDSNNDLTCLKIAGNITGFSFCGRVSSEIVSKVVNLKGKVKHKSDSNSL